MASGVRGAVSLCRIVCMQENREGCGFPLPRFCEVAPAARMGITQLIKSNFAVLCKGMVARCSGFSAAFLIRPKSCWNLVWYCCEPGTLSISLGRQFLAEKKGEHCERDPRNCALRTQRRGPLSNLFATLSSSEKRRLQVD